MLSGRPGIEGDGATGMPGVDSSREDQGDRVRSGDAAAGISAAQAHTSREPHHSRSRGPSKGPEEEHGARSRVQQQAASPASGALLEAAAAVAAGEPPAGEAAPPARTTPRAAAPRAGGAAAGGAGGSTALVSQSSSASTAAWWPPSWLAVAAGSSLSGGSPSRRSSERLGLFTLAMTAANHARTAQLARMYSEMQAEVSSNREIVASLEERVEAQSGSLSALEGDVERVEAAVVEQAGEMDSLRVGVEERRAEMQQALDACRAQLDAQRSQLESQERTLQLLSERKLRSDALLDASLVAVAALLANSPLVALPSRLIAAILALPTSRRTVWRSRGQALMKWVAFLLIFAQARGYARRVGAHANVGNWPAYGGLLRGWAGRTWQRWVQSTTAPEGADGDDGEVDSRSDHAPARAATSADGTRVVRAVRDSSKMWPP